MTPGFCYNGIHSTEFAGLYVKTTANPLLPGKSLRRTAVPGRAGAFVFEGEPENKTLSFLCTLAGGSLPERRETARQIALWLSGPPGELVLDYEPDKAYQAVRTVSDVSAMIGGGSDSFRLSFECEPYQYGEIHEVSGAGTIALHNAGNAAADSLVILSGNGTVTLGDQSFTINGAPFNSYVDSKRLAVYGLGFENLSRFHTGGFLRIAPGDSVLTASVGITNVVVRWRDTWL